MTSRHWLIFLFSGICGWVLVAESYGFLRMPHALHWLLGLSMTGGCILIVWPIAVFIAEQSSRIRRDRTPLPPQIRPGIVSRWPQSRRSQSISFLAALALLWLLPGFLAFFGLLGKS